MLIWEAELLSRLPKLPPLPEYLGDQKQADPPEMLNMRLMAGARGLKTITLRDALRSM